MFHTNLRKRNLYLQQLKAFRDMEKVKIISGIRHCSKPSLMKLTADHLRECGIGDNQIIGINFESMRFYDMTAKEFYAYVTERAVSGKRMYLFFEEVQ